MTDYFENNVDLLYMLLQLTVNKVNIGFSLRYGLNPVRTAFCGCERECIEHLRRFSNEQSAMACNGRSLWCNSHSV